MRLGMLAVCTAIVQAVCGALLADLQPSARLVLLTAVTGLLAPFFRPGNAARAMQSAALVALWSVGATIVAAIAISITQGAGVAWPRAFAACAVLLLICLVTHAAAAILEQVLQPRAHDAGGAHDAATWFAVSALVAAGAAPLWLGPAAELMSAGATNAIDRVVGASPLSHLAVASGNDLLRNQWFYQHANLAALQFSYPDLAGIAWSYVAAGVLLALAALASRRPRTRAVDATPR